MILQVPLPRNLDLAMPLPDSLLSALLIVSFLLHILFVNLMLGGTILCFYYEWRGLKLKKYDKIAQEIAKTITVNKSMAVVLGVAPLLTINTIYTMYFYTANALTGVFWISIIPWITLCFLALYWHKYSWNRMKNKRKHIAILGFVVFSFLFIPLIFLVNTNLMLFPEKWTEVSGFLSTLTIGNVLPRYLHFITASIAITALFLYAYFVPKYHKRIDLKTNFTKVEIKREFLKMVFAATLFQFIFGPLVYFTLPRLGLNWGLLSFLLPALVLVVGLMFFLYRILYVKKQIPAYAFRNSLFVFGMVVVCMVLVRDVYRESTLQDHKVKMKLHTQHSRDFMDAELSKIHAEAKVLIATKMNLNSGQSIFESKCKMCHDFDTKLVGPPLKEVLKSYSSNKGALKKWIKNPGRKRMEYPKMAGFPNMEENDLDRLVEYLQEQ